MLSQQDVIYCLFFITDVFALDSVIKRIESHSAISIAEDSSLRRSIKDSAQQQLKLLDSIGTAEMEDRLEKKVLEVIKSNAENLMQQSGIEPSLLLSEAKQYLYEVLDEVKNRKSR